MPAEVAEVEEVEEILEDGEIEEMETTTTTTTTKRQRLSKDNIYLYDDAQSALEAKKSIVYDDGSKVEGFRVFGFALPPADHPADKKFELTRNKERFLTNATAFVVARNEHIASAWFLESLGYASGLYHTLARSGAGRSKSTIISSMLEFGKMLAMTAFGQSPPEGENHNGIKSTPWDLAVVDETQANTFNQFFGKGETYDHFREEDGTWKPATKEG